MQNAAAGTVSTMIWSCDMGWVYLAGGAAAAGLIGYGVYKAYEYVTAAHKTEAAKEEGLHEVGAHDAGAPPQ